MLTLSEKNSLRLKLLLTFLGLILSYYLISTMGQQPLSVHHDLSVLFKVYFIVAFIFFIYTQFKRYSLVEVVSLTSLLVSIFCLLSFSSTIIIFTSLILLTLSYLSFLLTRFRPGSDIITSIYLILILSLMYNVSSLISLIGIFIILFIFLFKSQDSSIDSLIITFLIPLVIFLMVKNLGDYTYYMVPVEIFSSVVRVLSLSIIVLSSLFFGFLMSHKKTSFSYSVFYLSHALYAVSINTTTSLSVALIMVFLLPFILSRKNTVFSVYNLSMLPLAPSFMLKIVILGISMDSGLVLDYSIMILSHLVVIFYSFQYLLPKRLSFFLMGSSSEKMLSTLSFFAVLVCLIYLNTIKNIVESALLNVLG